MADVAWRPDDRAQLLLVAAIGLAILLAVLAVALNTAAYGGIHASQADDSLREERAAVQYQDSVQRAVAGLLSSSDGTATGYEELENGLRSDVETWDDLSKPEYVRDGAVTNASVTNVSFESRIVHDEGGAFTDRNGSTGWTLAADASDVDEFELEVRDESLAASDDCTEEDDCFTLVVEGRDGDTWKLFAATDDDTGGVELVVETSNGTDYRCETTDSSAGVDVASGVFADDTGGCEFASFTDDAGVGPPYTLRYANAENATGTYDLTVSGRVAQPTIDEDERYGTTSSPRIEPGIDAANVSVGYRSPDLTYRTEVRVTPGEDDA